MKKLRFSLLLIFLLTVGLSLSACGSKEEPQKHVHTFDEGVYNAPSCTENGSTVYTCISCGETKTENIPATGHRFGDGQITKAATCTKDGTKVSVCTVCGATKVEAVPALGHSFGGWQVETPAGAFTEGKELIVCKTCKEVKEERTIPADADRMPHMNFTGNYLSASKTQDAKMQVTFTSPDGTEFDCYALIHWQGGTSASFPKKNYTMKLYEDGTFSKKNKVNLGWGKESKYCLKANYVDVTQGRNVVTCRLWKEGVALRPESDLRTRLLGLKTNAGAIDGFPVLVYMNGEFHGLYTLNVPKDEWMFDMGDGEKEAIIMADGWNTLMDTPLDADFAKDKNGDYRSGEYELKFFSTEKTTGDVTWVRQSLNRVIHFLTTADDETFRRDIGEYLDLDSSIDYLLYLYAIYMRDNSAKNILWCTYDGKVWFPSVYDQDGTFGMAWDGYRVAPPNVMLPVIDKDGRAEDNIADANSNILWNRLLNVFPDKFYARYRELRESVLSEENVISVWETFLSDIPESLFDADFEKWPHEKLSNGTAWTTYRIFDIDYIKDWYPKRLSYLDDAMEKFRDALCK